MGTGKGNLKGLLDIRPVLRVPTVSAFLCCKNKFCIPQVELVCPGVMWICLQNNKQLFDSRLKGEKCCKSEKNLEPAILGLQKSDVGNHFCAS